MALQKGDLDEKGDNKVIVIALDSADPVLVEKWMKAGRLPFLASMVEQGAFARVTSDARIFSDAPWLSFYTGVSAQAHGCYNFLEVDRTSQKIFRANGRRCPYPPFWQVLKHTQTKVGNFDMSKTFPIEGLNGIQISGWGEEYPLIEACSLPKDIVGKISSRFGQYHHPREILNPRSQWRQVQSHKRLMAAVKQKLAAVKFVMNKEQDWGLFMANFAEGHYANHLFQHLQDRQHWAYEPQLAKKLENAQSDVYSAMDSALSDLLKDIPAETTVFFLSVHGCDTNYSANHLMPAVLERLGFQSNVDGQEHRDSSPLEKLSEQARNAIPRALRDFINDWIVPKSFHDEMHSKNFIRSINWPDSRAYYLPLGDFQAFININLRGRDLRGTVASEEYTSVCQQLIDDLKQLINLDTQKSAIQDIVPTGDFASGDYPDHLPDIVVKWAQDGPITRLFHPKFGEISGESYNLRKTQHTGNGFFIAKGQNINPNALLSQVREIDLTPTILTLLQAPIPDYMEGTILNELLSDRFKASVESNLESSVNNQTTEKRPIPVQR